MTDSMPTLSVVIPAYNVEKYIGDALRSLRAQSVAPDEIILVDDGSTDNTLEVARSFTFPCRYEVVSIPNGGQGHARNLGVSHSSSDYIYFFDSDDLVDEAFVQEIKAHIASADFPDLIMFSGEAFFDDSYGGAEKTSYSRGISGRFHSPVTFIESASAARGLFCQPCLYVSKRNLWGPSHLEFMGDYLEDDAIFYPLLFSCQVIDVVDRVYFYRRMRAGSTMTTRPNKKHVSGSINCINSAMRLYHSLPKRLERERSCVLKRLEGYSLAYLYYSRLAGQSEGFAPVLQSIRLTKSWVHLTKVLIYLARLNNIQWLTDRVRGIHKTR